jgi:hypothetical protein
MTFYGWGNSLRTRYYHKLKLQATRYESLKRWLDCNSWEREPHIVDEIPNWLQPCPKCCKDRYEEDV